MRNLKKLHNLSTFFVQSIDIDPIITIDVYGDTAEIIEDCLDDLQPFIDEVIPKEESESGTDFSEDNYHRTNQ